MVGQEFLEVAADYDGDELDAFRSRSRRRGTVVAFCAFEYHRVTPLEGGLRRSSASFLRWARILSLRVRFTHVQV